MRAATPPLERPLFWATQTDPYQVCVGLTDFFANATVAFQSGQTLAGIFLLRVFIEQYWRSLSAVSGIVGPKGKPTGDELADAYKATLPVDFKARFPSLSEVYASLSAAMHAASEDAALFEESAAKVIEHFEARRLFKLDSDSALPSKPA